MRNGSPLIQSSEAGNSGARAGTLMLSVPPCPRVAPRVRRCRIMPALQRPAGTAAPTGDRVRLIDDVRELIGHALPRVSPAPVTVFAGRFGHARCALMPVQTRATRAVAPEDAAAAGRTRSLASRLYWALGLPPISAPPRAASTRPAPRVRADRTPPRSPARRHSRDQVPPLPGESRRTRAAAPHVRRAAETACSVLRG